MFRSGPAEEVPISKWVRLAIPLGVCLAAAAARADVNLGAALMIATPYTYEASGPTAVEPAEVQTALGLGGDLQALWRVGRQTSAGVCASALSFKQGSPIQLRITAIMAGVRARRFLKPWGERRSNSYLLVEAGGVRLEAEEFDQDRGDAIPPVAEVWRGYGSVGLGLESRYGKMLASGEVRYFGSAGVGVVQVGSSSAGRYGGLNQFALLVRVSYSP